MKHFKQIPKISRILVLFVMPFVFGYAQAGSDYYNEDVPPKPKAFYDVNVTSPYTMRDFLGVIDATYDLFISKGAPPSKIKFVVSLRGLSVAFATNDFGMGGPDEQVGLDLRLLIDSLLSKNIRIEACIISCIWVGVDPNDLVEGVVVVDNAFASSIWYQTKGYALIPIHQLPPLP